MTLLCPYCGACAELTNGAVIYPYRSDLHAKNFYRCAPCDAWVGCHAGTTKPLGRLADAALRRAKQATHAAFDPLWKKKMLHDGLNRKKARKAAYSWLCEQLQIDRKDCHIGLFDVETCRRAIAICNEVRQTRERMAA